MGRKKTTVGTSVSRAIADDQMPNAIRTGITKALFIGGDLPEYILEEIVGSLGVKADRMYNYGRDHYTHGLPSGQFTVAAENIEDVVGTVLLSIENTAVVIDYLRHGAPNNLHIGWVDLMELHGYSPATNQLAALSVAKGTPVYLHDMVVVVPSTELATIAPETVQQWGIAARAGYTPQRQIGSPETRAMVLPTGIEGDPIGTAEYLRVEYVWQGLTGVEQDSFTIPITGYDDNADYFHVRYLVGGVVKYWMYREGAGTHPTLDVLFDKTPIPNGSFFPFAYFRYAGVSETENPTSQSYLTNKKLVKYLGMDFDMVAEAVEANPGIDDVLQAMLIMAVPANTTNELEQRYLWEFFNNVFLASSLEHRHRTEQEAAVAANTAVQAALSAPGIVIQDTRFQMVLDNQGIYKRRKAGNLGPIGSFHSSFSTMPVSFEVTDQGEASATYTVIEDIGSHFYRRQVSTGFYDEIQVVEMRTLFNINGRFAIGNDDGPILIVPLDRSITSEFSIPEREILYARSLHFVFNSEIITKVQWYQSGPFQFVMLVAAVYMTVASLGADGGSAIAAALAGANYATAVYLTTVVLIKMVVFRAVFKLFVKVVGLEAAFAIAIVAALAGVYDSSTYGASLVGTPFAMDLLTFSSGLMQGIQAETQALMQDLLGQSRELELLQKEQTKLLDAAKELLESNNFLSPFVIFGEKPDDFYNRTVHSGNIGVVGIDAISSFVTHALKLPELNDSLGDRDV